MNNKPAILISIQPKWCEKIASGEKTIEVRKTCPKIETPFKCYIYCTKGEKKLLDILKDGENDYFGEVYHGKTSIASWYPPVYLGHSAYDYAGKVIGEFVCRGIMRPYSNLSLMVKQSCLTIDELDKYSNGKELFGWRIADLKIYDEPKELVEFYKGCNRNANCYYCRKAEFYGGKCIGMVIRPPKSYMYVEPLEIE